MRIQASPGDRSDIGCCGPRSDEDTLNRRSDERKIRRRRGQRRGIGNAYMLAWGCDWLVEEVETDPTSELSVQLLFEMIGGRRCRGV